MNGFQIGGEFPQFNGSMNNTYGSYNQAPNAVGRRGGGGGVGPVRGGYGRFMGKSQGPYGGINFILI